MVFTVKPSPTSSAIILSIRQTLRTCWSQLIDNADTLLDDKTYARVNLDISISYEEANFIKETMLTQYGARELSLIPAKQQLELTDGAVDMAFESVDQIVIGQIQGLDTSHYDKKLLLDIYTNL